MSQIGHQQLVTTEMLLFRNENITQNNTIKLGNNAVGPVTDTEC